MVGATHPFARAKHNPRPHWELEVGQYVDEGFWRWPVPHWCRAVETGVVACLRERTYYDVYRRSEQACLLVCLDISKVALTSRSTVLDSILSFTHTYSENGSIRIEPAQLSCMRRRASMLATSGVVRWGVFFQRAKAAQR